MTETRHNIVVDVETNGRDIGIHECVEVGYWDLFTGQRGVFVPPHNPGRVLAVAEIRALQLNRYVDRLATAPQDTSGKAAGFLADLLHGNTLAGANPGFDAKFLTKMFMTYESGNLCPIPEWHYRPWDLEAYAAGVLGLDYVPGLDDICERLGVELKPEDRHTAAGDVTAEGMCFRALQSIVAQRKSEESRLIHLARPHPGDPEIMQGEQR